MNSSMRSSVPWTLKRLNRPVEEEVVEAAVVLGEEARTADVTVVAVAATAKRFRRPSDADLAVSSWRASVGDLIASFRTILGPFPADFGSNLHALKVRFSQT